MDRIGKAIFGNLLEEFGDAAAPVIRKVITALGGGASEATARKALRQQGYKPISQNEAAQALSAAATPPKPKEKSLAARASAPAVVSNVSGSRKRAASSARYDVDKVAQDYPDTAPPVLAVDKNTGREFLQKQLSSEAEALSAARRAAQKDIEAGNFTPYFAPDERFYANPEAYNLQGNTLVDAMPKRADTIAKYEARATDPAAVDRLKQAYLRGLEHPDAADWYAMGQLEKSFIDQYGPEAGRMLFKERFADAMAATTGGADPTSNLLMAQYGNNLRVRGAEIPSETYNLPFPIGGRYASGNMAMFDKLINQGAGLTTGNPKRFNFSGNFLGDTKRATIDEQMSGLFEPGMAIPPGDSYGVYERALGDIARDFEVDPANFQDIAWAGGKLAKTPNFQPKPMIQILNETIERTARVTGRDPDEVVEEVIVKAARPTYAKGGFAVKKKPQ